MVFVYLTQHSEKKDFYVGMTKDLEERITHHNSGLNKSTKRLSGTWILVYYEAFRSEKDARLREIKLKSHGKGKQKLLKRISDSLV